MGRNTQVVIENNNLCRGPGGTAGAGRGSRHRRQRLCVTARSSHPAPDILPAATRPPSHPGGCPRGRGRGPGFSPRPPASRSPNGGLGPGLEGEGGPGVSPCPSALPPSNLPLGWARGGTQSSLRCLIDFNRSVSFCQKHQPSDSPNASRSSVRSADASYTHRCVPSQPQCAVWGPYRPGPPTGVLPPQLSNGSC